MNLRKIIAGVLMAGLVMEGACAKSLVIYFSRADENYSVGTVSKGNTRVLAEIIAEMTGSDMFCIERQEAYPKDYNTCINAAQKEQRAKARPALKEMMTQAQLDQYDVIYFGSPVWWGDLPMPVYTFIESLNWNGKKVWFFGTHEGSGASGIASCFRTAAKGCLMQGSPLSMYGHDAQKNDDRERAAVRKWLGL